MPDGTIVGHIHLCVGGIPQAEGFYHDVLGLDVTARRTGATFFATSGYHHYLATNTWQRRNAPKRSGTITGLSSFDLVSKMTHCSHFQECSGLVRSTPGSECV